jgi:hypothetical protein
MKKGCILLVAAALLAAGSVPATSAKRETKNGLGGCLAAVQMWSVGFKHEIASFMGVSLDRMPSLFCQRLAEGVRSGRIGYSDINRLQLDQATEIWLVIKGKSKAASAAQAPAPWTRKFRTCSGVHGAFQVPASQECPMSNFAPPGIGTVVKSKPKAKQAPPAWTRKFRTCDAITGSFQIPASQNCPLSGHANYGG